VTEGFCITHKTDVPVDAERRCLTDRMVAIPPSWGKRGMRWTGTGWEGDQGRPVGYVYRPRFSDTPADTTPTTITVTCQHVPCGRRFEATIRGGTPPRYCPGTPCKSRASNARKDAAKANLKQYAGVAS